jgi:uncharacterized protein YcbK (DUF882 family)
MSGMGLEWVVALFGFNPQFGVGAGSLPGVSCVGNSRVTDFGVKNPLTKRFARALASAAIVGTLALGAWTFAHTSATVAGGETRTLSFYHTHTKESMTVTYMRNGRYVPSEMKKVNHFLRDWRRNEVITIDPKTLDLVWELHADLGSKRPVHIVSGYRSPRTNAFLRKIGRKVAKKSQHMKGKAIDFYFPDVTTLKIRNSALVRKVGGVGYYRSSGGPSGFLHVDSGNVRHWGPAISKSQMASIVREGGQTVGKRLKNKTADMVPVQQVADENDDEASSGGIWGLVTGKRGKKQPAIDPAVAPLDAYAGGELAQYSADAAALEDTDDEAEGAPLDAAIVDTPRVKKPTPINPDTDGLASMAQTAAVESLAEEDFVASIEQESAGPTIGYILKPRLKPRDVLVMASSNVDASGGVTILPASAPPESQTFKKRPSPVATALAAVSPDETFLEEDLVSNESGKTSFADIREETTEEAPDFEPDFTSASFSSADASWWKRLWSSAKELQAEDSVAASVKADLGDVMPQLAVLGDDGQGIQSFQSPTAAEGKGNLLVVNREGKGSLPPMKLRLSQATSILDDAQ